MYMYVHLSGHYHKTYIHVRYIHVDVHVCTFIRSLSQDIHTCTVYTCTCTRIYIYQVTITRHTHNRHVQSKTNNLTHSPSSIFTATSLPLWS